MRGSPPLHLALIALAFVLFALPLARLTFARTQAPVVVAAPEQEATSTQIRLRFAHMPVSTSVQCEGRELAQENSKSPGRASLEFETDLIIPKEGIEFVVNVTWPEGTPDTAVSMEIEPDGLDAKSLTRWSNGARMEEVFAFEWKP